MTNLPPPTPARLGPPGRYTLPTAEGFVGPGGVAGQLPIQLHFALADGTELHLPMSDIALGRLYTALRGLYEPPGEGRSVRRIPVTEPPTLYWDDIGSTVNMDFLHADGTTIVLEIPAAIFAEMPETIAEAQSSRPRQP
jgi:hypothetical protein